MTSNLVEQDDWKFSYHRGASRLGIVLVHEIYGLDDYANSVAAQLAEQEVSVAAVDMFRGKHPTRLEEGIALRTALKESDVVAAMQAGLKLLVHKIGNDAKVGSMGFCMGGGLALLGACKLDYKFCVDYYGLIENAEAVKDLKGPVLMILASDDERVTPWAFQYFLPAAMKYKKRIDLQLYPNVRHAFHRPNWEGHNPAAASDAMKRTLEFIAPFK